MVLKLVAVLYFFSFPNAVIFAVGNSSSVHVDDRKKDILVLSEGLAQRLDYDTMIPTETKYFINLRRAR